MVGWHNAVATSLGVGREPGDGKAMLNIDALAFPTSPCVPPSPPKTLP